MATTKVKILSLLTIILLLFVGVVSFFYFGYLSEGNRAGVVIKISHRGYFFKTWEGELNLNDQGNTIKKFKFSVENDQTKVVEDLKDVALTGERISVTYIERHKIFFWRGQTKYFITEVVRQKIDLSKKDTEVNSSSEDEKIEGINEKIEEIDPIQKENLISTDSI